MTNNYEISALKYLLPYFRTQTPIKNLIQSIGRTFEHLAMSLTYLRSTLDISTARGVWLDKIGREVGAQRDEKEYGNYFCINRQHINTEKMFYFTNSGIDPYSPINLEDAEFVQKIRAYIGANNSGSSVNELVKIIKTITNAEKVIITHPSSRALSIEIISQNAIQTENTTNYIQNIVATGVNITVLTITKS